MILIRLQLLLVVSTVAFIAAMFSFAYARYGYSEPLLARAAYFCVGFTLANSMHVLDAMSARKSKATQ